MTYSRFMRKMDNTSKGWHSVIRMKHSVCWSELTTKRNSSWTQTRNVILSLAFVNQINAILGSGVMCTGGAGHVAGGDLCHPLHAQGAVHLQGLDVRIARTRRQCVAAHQAVDRRRQAAVRLEPAQALQLPGLAAAPAAAHRQRHHDTGNNTFLFYSQCTRRQLSLQCRTIGLLQQFEWGLWSLEVRKRLKNRNI